MEAACGGPSHKLPAAQRLPAPPRYLGSKWRSLSRRWSSTELPLRQTRKRSNGELRPRRATTTTEPDPSELNTCSDTVAIVVAPSSSSGGSSSKAVSFLDGVACHQAARRQPSSSTKEGSSTSAALERSSRLGRAASASGSLAEESVGARKRRHSISTLRSSIRQTAAAVSLSLEAKHSLSRELTTEASVKRRASVRAAASDALTTAMTWHLLVALEIDVSASVRALCYEVVGPSSRVRALPPDKRKHLRGQLGAPWTIELTPEQRDAAGVPPSAVRAAFAYPTRLVLPGAMGSEQWVFLLLLGGFCYFDADDRLVRVNALSLVPAKGAGGRRELRLRGPCPLSHAAHAALKVRRR